MNSRDIKIFNEMISEAWNDNNAFCRKMKEYIGKHFKHIPELKERCKAPYWVVTGFKMPNKRCRQDEYCKR